MLSFETDYIQGAHPRLLERLVETNLEPQSGYGEDIYCTSAKEKLRAAFDCPEADIFFLVGGTQTNAVVIDTVLHAGEGVLAAENGHVAVHEAGAIEYTGHKVLTLPGHDGKVAAADVQAYLDKFYGDATWSHMVAPGMVYISHPSEFGTLYTKAELTALSQVCRRAGIPLFLDGARLGYGLMSRETDVTAADIARLCDVFYVGGTKVGALCGEAVVFPRGDMPPRFLTLVKQHGALLAKGRLLGVQFDALFTDGLYWQISRQAIDRAEQLKALFRNKGYTFARETSTNQQYILLEDTRLAELQRHVVCSFWEKPDAAHTVVRFCTSWATTEDELRQLEQLL